MDSLYLSLSSSDTPVGKAQSGGKRKGRKTSKKRKSRKSKKTSSKRKSRKSKKTKSKKRSRKQRGGELPAHLQPFANLKKEVMKIVSGGKSGDAMKAELKSMFGPKYFLIMGSITKAVNNKYGGNAEKKDAKAALAKLSSDDAKKEVMKIAKSQAGKGQSRSKKRKSRKSKKGSKKRKSKKSSKKRKSKKGSKKRRSKKRR